MRIEVECRSGYRGDEEPRAIQIGGRKLAVDAIVDRWYGPDHRYFKLRCEDGRVWLVRHDERADAWELTGYLGEQGSGRSGYGRTRAPR